MSIISRRVFYFIFLGFISFILFGCALSPKKLTTRIASDELLTAQMDKIEKVLEKTPQGERTLIYIGSAQNSQSLAFQRDVLLVQKKLLAANTNTQSIILSNELETSKLTYPFATLHTLTQTFDRVAAWSKKYPLTLVLLISTHGNVDVLSSNVANEYYTPIQTRHLQPWLDRLGDTPTAIILSACFSGSFLPALAAPNRLIFTAAAADRNSFGCDYHEDNTYFISEFFGVSFAPEKTWQENFDMTKVGVGQREKALGNVAASNPQSSFLKTFAVKSVADFLKP
jgi:hypothetical protein